MPGFRGQSKVVVIVFRSIRPSETNIRDPSSNSIHKLRIRLWLKHYSLLRTLNTMNTFKDISANEADWSCRLIRELADASLHIDSSEHAIVLKDRFPKSRRHYLVLPRKEINTVYDLTAADIELLEHMFKLGQCVASSSGLDLNVFRYGFHMEPHMKRLHLHVISRDFDSPHLKRIRHWNIFNTKLFMTFDDVLQELRTNGKIERRPADCYEKLHNSRMRCNVCAFSADKVWKMKQHIRRHW